MAVDPDVYRIAKRWGMDPTLIQAVVKAEGNILRAVQCSIPSVKTREEAIEITCRSAVHALCDFLDDSRLRPEFVNFWAARWAPQGAVNDPTGLNQNWAGNVLEIWEKA